MPELTVLIFLVTMHALATILAPFSPLLVLLLALCSCGDFTSYAFRLFSEKRPGPVLLTLYGAPLAVLMIAMMSQVATRPRACLLTLIAFSVLAFFSDNVLRWVLRREP